MAFRRGRIARSAGDMVAAARHEIVPLRAVEAQLDHLPPASTVTVTSSPRLGLERTLDYTALLAARGFDAVPHLAARDVVDEAHLERTVARVRTMGVRDVFVIGGDGHDGDGAYGSAVELVEALGELGRGLSRIGVAAYPEGHPAIDDDKLLGALLRKQRVAHYMVSQMCFDPLHLVGWLRRLRDLGVQLPLYVGIPGAVRRAKLLELSFKLGVGPSIRYLSKNRGLVAGLARPGTYHPRGIVAGISQSVDDPSLHIAGFQVFTFNEVVRTVNWERRATAMG